MTCKPCKQSAGLFYYNICSLPNKADAVLGFLQNMKHDILCFSEHWLIGEQINSIKLPCYVLASSFSRAHHEHGGVAVFVREGIKYKTIDVERFTVEMHAEFCAVKITELGLIIVTLYRSSSSGNFSIFHDKLESLLRFLFGTGCGDVVVVGDFNVHFHDANNKESKEVLNIFNSYGLGRKVFFHTRVTEHGASCIDGVFTNIRDGFCHVSEMEPCLSDHRAIYVELSRDQPSNSPETYVFRRVITAEAMEGLRNHLAAVDLDPLLNCCNDMDFVSQYIVRLYSDYVEQHCPLRKCEIGGRYPTKWFNGKLKQMRCTLSALQTASRVSKNPTDLGAFKNYRKLYLKAIRDRKREAYGDFLINSKNRCRDVWRLIDFECNRKVRVDGCSITPDQFNNSFLSQVENITNGFGDDGLSSSDVCFRQKEVMGSFFLEPITETDVLCAIFSQRRSGSTDPYGITVGVLRATADVIVPSLTRLFNKCIEQGTFPGPFKVSKVVPIHKRGDVDSPENYRPIAITPLFGRVFEFILKRRLSAYFEDKDLLSDSQFGFRSSRSTCDALESFVGGVVGGFEERNLTAGLLFDLRRAFDCVSHGILINKLELYGVRGLPLMLISSYLRDRVQYVNVGNMDSEVKMVRFGVPQGSILGPLLFLIYVNDLPYYIKSARVTLYADDTSLLVSGESVQELTLRSNAAEEAVKAWFLANKLELNTDKTQNIIFSLNPRVYSGKTVKHLGVSLDDSLRWEEHVNRLCGKLSAQLFVLRRLRGVLDQRALLTAYHAVFHSRVKYCVSLYGGSVHAGRVLKLQKKALRIICNKNFRYSCRGLFKQLKILTVTSEFIYSTVVKIHARKHTYLTHSDVHHYPTRHRSELVVPAVRLTTSARNVLDVRLYNKLPENIRGMNLHNFKSKVRAYLLDSTVYTCQEFMSARPRVDVDFIVSAA